jgi:protein-arginine kinase activator protein McsA
MGGKKKEVKEKPLEKMTATELRSLAMEIPGIVGVHGMNKNELVSEIKTARGLSEGSIKKSSGKVRELKEKIRDLKDKLNNFLDADDTKMADLYRKRIIRLKKKTRRVD